MVDRAHGHGMLALPARRVRTLCEHVFVRWDNLTIDEDEGTRLPGYRDPATIRRFDAPEALDMRFYEIHAKSAINRVPEASKMPFRWTINPYRGCTHACVYCLRGETPILMADGSHRPLGSAAGRRRDLRHRARRPLPALRPHAGARSLGERQAGVPRRARGRHRARSPAAITASSPSAAGSTSPAAQQGREQAAAPHDSRSSLLGHRSLRGGAASTPTTTSAATCAGSSAVTATWRRTPTTGPDATSPAVVHRFRLALVRRRGARACRALPASRTACTRRRSPSMPAPSRTTAGARDQDAVAVAVRARPRARSGGR